MTRAARWLLWAGVLLFAAVLASQGFSAVLSTLSSAGWGLVLVAAFHALPLLLDAAAMRVLFDAKESSAGLRGAVLVRWAGESANSLLPAGQIGGPVLMARLLARRGLNASLAAAVMTVVTTLQTVAQIAFALTGVALLATHAAAADNHTLLSSAIVASGLLALQIGGFYWLQRRGLFSKAMRVANRFCGKRDWSGLITRAAAIDEAVQAVYGRSGRVAASGLLNFAGWLVGTGEVYFILLLLGSPVSWLHALVLESLGQAIRGAAFAVPGALGVQEGGYLLLAPLAGLPPDIALALSLAKRSRELILGVPGLAYLHFTARDAFV